MEYQELEIIKDSFNEIHPHELRPFLMDKIIKDISTHKVTIFRGYNVESTEAYYLYEIFPLLIENGWEYKSTYWKGGENGHKILTFVRGEYKK